MFITVRHYEKLRKSCSKKDIQREQKTRHKMFQGRGSQPEIQLDSEILTHTLKLRCYFMVVNYCNLDIHTERERESNKELEWELMLM